MEGGRPAWGWLLAAVAAVVYGSLIPFDLDIATFSTWRGAWLHPLCLPFPPVEDFVTNLLLYVPIGLLAVPHGPAARPRSLRCVVLAIAIGASVSLTVETLQICISVRVASWWDVLLNSVGSALGAVVGLVAAYAWPRLRLSMGDGQVGVRSMTLAVGLLTGGLLLYHLVPFEFVTDTASLQASFLRARWELPAMFEPRPGEPPFTQLATHLTAAAWFALLAFMRCCCGTGSKRTLAHRALSATKHCVILVVIIELMQLFSRGHAFEFGAILLRSMSAGVGALLAVYVAESACRSRTKSTIVAVVPTAVLCLLIAFQVAGMMLVSFDPQSLNVGGQHPIRVHWIPFEALWRLPMLTAVHQLVVKFVSFSALALTLGIVLRRVRWSRVWPVTGVALLLMASVSEASLGATASTQADLTNPILACVSVLLTARLFPALRSLFVSVPAT